MQEPPGASGINLANWYWKVVRAVCPGAVRHWVEPKQLCELAAPAGVCLQAPKEAAAQGG